MQTIHTFLKNVGLSEKETAIYTTLLQLGPQAASVVAKKININRSSVFFHLDKLIKKGFVQKQVRPNIQFFNAVEPEKLNHLLERRKRKIDEQMDQLNEMIPLFEGIQPHFSTESKVTYFEGVDGLCSMIDLFTDTHEDLYFICDHLFHSELKRYIQNVYVPSRKKAKNKVQMIITDPKNCGECFALAQDTADWVGCPQGKGLNFESNLVIYGETVLLFSLKKEDLTGVLIKNSFLAETMRLVFEVMKGKVNVKELI